MNIGRKPALVQWKLPLGHAAVPAKKILSSKQKQLVRIVLGKSMSVTTVGTMKNTGLCWHLIHTGFV